ncbi:hypothetical protein Dimus_030046 [Dionaea muscipula]
MAAATTSSLPWHPLLHNPSRNDFKKLIVRTPPTPLPSSARRMRSAGGGTIRAFRRSDFDSFARRMASGEAWKDAWRSANDGFEQFVFETRKAAERLNRRYSVSLRLSSVARAAADRALEIDREFEVTQRWRTFSLDFRRNWPRYRKQLNDFFNTPLGKGFTTIFFIWFALSGWLFRIFILATWVLPLAGPFLIGAAANKLVVQGACPSCKRQFVGYKSQVIRCPGCGNIVWQPEINAFGRGPKGGSKSKSKDEIIDVEYEER